MAHYLVKAKPIPEKMEDLRARISRGEIVKMIPFGRGLHNSLSDARWDGRGWALWEELDFCNPPLKIEREAVLDEYFDSYKFEPVAQGEGWAQIRTLPRLLHSEIPIPQPRNGSAGGKTSGAKSTGAKSGGGKNSAAKTSGSSKATAAKRAPAPRKKKATRRSGE